MINLQRCVKDLSLFPGSPRKISRIHVPFYIDVSKRKFVGKRVDLYLNFI